VRRLFGRGLIDAALAKSLLKDPSAMDGWNEYTKQKSAADAADD
jgi:hypothetical protein